MLKIPAAARLVHLFHNLEPDFIIYVAGSLLFLFLVVVFWRSGEPVSPDVPFVGPRRRHFIASPAMDVARLKEGYIKVRLCLPAIFTSSCPCRRQWIT